MHEVQGVPEGWPIADLVDVTKKGGYSEIPEELVTKEASRVGLESIPKVVVEEGIRRAWVGTSSSGEVEVHIPRRLHRSSVPSNIRHELAHVKLGHMGTTSPSSAREVAREEMLVDISSDGRVDSRALIESVQALMLDFNLPKSEALRIVIGEAKSLGVSSRSISSAKKYFRYRPSYLKDWYTSKDLEVLRRGGVENVPKNAWEEILK